MRRTSTASSTTKTTTIRGVGAEFLTRRDKEGQGHQQTRKGSKNNEGLLLPRIEGLTSDQVGKFPVGMGKGHSGRWANFIKIGCRIQ
jgi:hypothetical protein